MHFSPWYQEYSTWRTALWFNSMVVRSIFLQLQCHHLIWHILSSYTWTVVTNPVRLGSFEWYWIDILVETGESSSAYCCHVHGKPTVEFVARVHNVEQVSWQIPPDYSTRYVPLCYSLMCLDIIFAFGYFACFTELFLLSNLGHLKAS